MVIIITTFTSLKHTFSAIIPHFLYNYTHIFLSNNKNETITFVQRKHVPHHTGSNLTYLARFRPWKLGPDQTPMLCLCTFGSSRPASSGACESITPKQTNPHPKQTLPFGGGQKQKFSTYQKKKQKKTNNLITAHEVLCVVYTI